ncbi:MAG: cysteine desulfurase-like protein [Gemmatimonadaceae bacterium]
MSTTQREAVGAAGLARVAGVDEIRAHFPALERRHGGRPVAYFDGPGGTQVPRAVVSAMTDYLLHHNANTAWAYPTSEETDAAILEARGALADYVNAAPDEIAFGANMTTLTFHVARAIGRRLGPGDEIVVTELDHHANVAPWAALAQERGVTIRTVRLTPETGLLDWNDLERQIGARTRVVAIGAASNALGTVNDVRRAARAAHAVGALAFVDAVHFAAHALADVRATECDLLACSAYKFYGPHIGILYGRRDLLEDLDVPKLIPAPDEAPERLETGTQNHEGMVGAGAAVDWLASLAASDDAAGATGAVGATLGDRRARLAAAFDALEHRSAALFARLWEGLSALGPRVRLFGPAPGTSPRTPTVSFVVDGIPAIDVSRALAARGVFISHGDFYATTVAERMGQAETGLVRAGCACYTTEEEVERLLEGVAELVSARAYQAR